MKGGLQAPLLYLRCADDLCSLMSRRRHVLRVLVDTLKSVPCMDCGNTFPSQAMSFDHRDPDTKVECIGWFLRKGDEEGLRAEVLKCDVVCHNCHAVRTSTRGLTAKQRQKVGDATRRVAKEVQNRPEVRAKKATSQSISMKRYFAETPGAHEKFSEAQLQSHAAHPERAQHQSEALKERWRDPEYKASQSETFRSVWATKVQSQEFNSEEAKAARTARANKMWEKRRARTPVTLSPEQEAEKLARKREQMERAWATRRASKPVP